MTDRKQKEFEDLIECDPRDKSLWVNYAKWEESQNDLERGHAIWNRALQKNIQDHSMWLMYADMLMKNNLFDLARNARDLAITIMPSIDELWYKYIGSEEMLGNVADARYIFERSMHWMPEQQGWWSYTEFELKYNEMDKGREIFERFVQCHPKVGVWTRFAKFEMENGEAKREINCYERVVDKLADDEEAEQLFIEFAEFEEKCKEADRARHIYKFVLDRIPKGRAQDLYRKFIVFEKQYGHSEGIDDAIIGGKRRFSKYEDQVRKNPKLSPF